MNKDDLLNDDFLKSFKDGSKHNENHYLLRKTQ